MIRSDKMRFLLVYDTAIHPLTFDLVIGLVQTKLISHKINQSFNFDIAILNRGGRNVGVESKYSSNDQLRKFINVLLQTIDCAKFLESKYIFNEKNIVDFQALVKNYDNVLYDKSHVGNPLFDIRRIEHLANQEQTKDVIANNWHFDSDRESNPKEVLLHVRYSKFSNARNTPYQLCINLYYYLRDQGFQLSLIPDIEDVNSDYTWSVWPGKIYESASNNIFERLTLAHSVRLNLLWSGGVVAPVIFSSVPYLFFGLHNRSHPLCTLEYFGRKGPNPLRQPNFLSHAQFWDWTEVNEITLASLIREIDRLLSLTV